VNREAELRAPSRVACSDLLACSVIILVLGKIMEKSINLLLLCDPILILLQLLRIAKPFVGVSIALGNCSR